MAGKLGLNWELYLVLSLRLGKLIKIKLRYCELYLVLSLRLG
jgi:hypothetical protein